jgi:hypothetical protein
VTNNFRTPAKLEQAILSQSVVELDSSYNVPTSIAMDRLALTLSLTGSVKTTWSKYWLLHFGFVAQWHIFWSSVISRQIYFHRETSLPKELLFLPRFNAVDYGPVWMEIWGYINRLCVKTPTDLRK